MNTNTPITIRLTPKPGKSTRNDIGIEHRSYDMEKPRYSDPDEGYASVGYEFASAQRWMNVMRITLTPTEEGPRPVEEWDRLMAPLAARTEIEEFIIVPGEDGYVFAASPQVPLPAESAFEMILNAPTQLHDFEKDHARKWAAIDLKTFETFGGTCVFSDETDPEKGLFNAWDEWITKRTELLSAREEVRRASREADMRSIR